MSDMSRGVWNGTPPSGVSFSEHRESLVLHLYGFVKKTIHYQSIVTPVWLSLGSRIMACLQDSPVFTPLDHVSAVDRLAALSIPPFAEFHAFGQALKEVGELSGLRVFVEPTKTCGSVWTTSSERSDGRICLAEYEVTGT